MVGPISKDVTAADCSLRAVGTVPRPGTGATTSLFVAEIDVVPAVPVTMSRLDMSTSVAHCAGIVASPADATGAARTASPLLLRTFGSTRRSDA